MENETEKIEILEGKFDRLPIGLRLSFQRVVFKKLGIEHDVDKVLTDGKIISDFIDNSDNVEVRGLIKENKFEEAAEILILEIKKKEDLSKAA